MSDLNPDFNKGMNELVNELVENAEVFKETKTINYKLPKLEEGITEESITKHNDFQNRLTLAAEEATRQIGAREYPESKITEWNGSLNIFGSSTVNTNVILHEERGEADFYGESSTIVDHFYGDALTNWRTEHQSAFETKVKGMFDKK